MSQIADSTTEPAPTSNADPTSALVVVDVQNDFADPDGSLFVQGGPEVVNATNAAIDAAAERGQLIVYTQDWHPPETPHFIDHGGVWPTHCVRDTWGAALHPDLRIAGPVVRKGTGGEDGYSGFSMRDVDTGAESPTELAAILDEHGITAITVVGLAFDVCVKATALDGVGRGLDVTVDVGASASVELTEGDHDRAAAELTAAGVHLIG